jgi:formate dehydrogenase iron-sulfur subunit
MSSLRIYVPGDAAAVAVGADDVASAIAAAAKRNGAAVEIVRNGSRGLHWLEPMVEVATAQGRSAYGPVTAADAAGILEAAMANGSYHPLRLGNPEDIPFLKNQTRLTFARCGIVDPRSLDDYRAHGGYKGLARALAMSAAAVVEEVTQSGLRGRGGAGFPTGIKW